MAVLIILYFAYVKLIQCVLFIWLYKKCAILPWSSINQISSIFPHSNSSIHCHSISICTVYSMYPLAWSKHYLCPPSWLRFECSSVAWESTTTLQLFGLDILIWLHNIIRPRRIIIFPWYVYTVSFRFHLFGGVDALVASYIHFETIRRRQLYNVRCTILYMYCRICSLAGYSSHPVRKYISLKP